ncbi:MAG: SelT/SelW/SelH family protein [Chloroflexi bacterium]|nr:SelT/SelW/SelH family protein [Chloroflexota bacterium]
MSKAVSLTDKILSMHKNGIASVTLLPSQGGAFEVLVDGKELYSKLKTGQFPDEMQIVNKVMGARLA